MRSSHTHVRDEDKCCVLGLAAVYPCGYFNKAVCLCPSKLLFFCLLFFPVLYRCHNKVYCNVHAGDVCSLSVYAVS